MKKIFFLLLPIFLFACEKPQLGFEIKNIPQEVHRNATLLSTSATYTSCTKTINDPTWQTLSMTRTIPVSGASTYTVDAIDTITPCQMHFKFKDRNGFYIQPDDTLKMTGIDYTICGSSYNLLLTGLPTYTLSGDTITINYDDCILPFNGTNGQITIKFIQ